MAINRKTLKNNSSKISALIITFNEINHIVEALDSISFADEIIVIDSFSSDGTLELLQKRKDVLVKTKKFKNFADQRNFALAQANYDWVLFIDADERITKPLKEEILKIVNTNSEVSGFKVRRKHFFKNKPRYSSKNPCRKPPSFGYVYNTFFPFNCIYNLNSSLFFGRSPKHLLPLKH